MQISDQEKKDLKTTMLVNGFSTYETDYFDSLSYKKLRETMMENLPYGNENRFHFDFFPKSEILKDGRFVIDKHFGKLDLRVPFADGDDMKTQLVALFGKEPKEEQYDEIIEYINNQIDLVRVTDIPVYLDTSAEKNGFVSVTRFYGYDVMKEDYFKKLPSYVKEIGLQGDCDENTKCIYVHEMGHALINRHKSNVQNLLNDEAFSIFMEKVAARDIDQSGNLLDLKILSRILLTKHNMFDREILEFREENFSGLLRSKQYIISTLHATAIFDIYSKGSNKLRSEIDTSLGQVISGEGILEDVFERYEASLEKGSKVMRRQIKTYQKTLATK